MTKVIIIQGGNLDNYYQATLEYLHQKYHNNPEVFGAGTSADQQLEISTNDSLARAIIKGGMHAGRGEAPDLFSRVGGVASVSSNVSLPPGKIVY